MNKYIMWFLVAMMLIVGFVVGSMVEKAYGIELETATVEGRLADAQASELVFETVEPAGDALVPAISTQSSDGGSFFQSGFTAEDVVPYPVAVQNMQSEARAMLGQLNSYRASCGLPPLVWDSSLEQTAMQRAAEISVYFNHTRTDGTMCFTAWESSGAAAENIAAGHASASDTLTQWKNSPGHDENMRGNYSSIGIACVMTPLGYGGYGYYWVQCFNSGPGDGTYTSGGDGPSIWLVPVPGTAVTSCYLESEQPVYVTHGGSNAIPPVYMAYGGTLSYPGDTDHGSSPSRNLSDEFDFNARILQWQSDDPTTVGFATSSAGNPVLVGASRGSTTITGRFSTAPNMNLTFTAVVTPVGRIAADTAAGTSALIAASGFDSADVAIVARADDFADAMSATGLAGALDAPIILTDRTALSEEAAWALDVLDVSRVYIIGGTGAISTQVDADIRALGITVEPRIWGDYSWDTSVECAKMIQQNGGNQTGEVIVAMSSNFQDALSISSFAYKYQVPIILEDQSRGAIGELPATAKDFIAKKTTGAIYVPGGPGAVNTDTVEGVFSGRTIIRIYGDDGFDTSNQIAAYMVSKGLLDPAVAAVTCGAQAPKGVDALAGSALVGKAGGVILLVNGNDALGDVELQTIVEKDSKGTNAFLTQNRAAVERVYVLGGTYVVPDATYRTIAHVFE